MVIVDFWRNQNNQKGLTPANGISPNYISLQKVLSDSNSSEYCQTGWYAMAVPEHRRI